MFLVEFVETENRNCCMTEATHFLRRKLRKDKCDLVLFCSGSVHEFYHLKELITLEQVNTSVVGKKGES